MKQQPARGTGPAPCAAPSAHGAGPTPHPSASFHAQNMRSLSATRRTGASIATGRPDDTHTATDRDRAAATTPATQPPASRFPQLRPHPHARSPQPIRRDTPTPRAPVARTKLPNDRRPRSSSESVTSTYAPPATSDSASSCPGDAQAPHTPPPARPELLAERRTPSNTSSRLTTGPDERQFEFTRPNPFQRAAPATSPRPGFRPRAADRNTAPRTA